MAPAHPLPAPARARGSIRALTPRSLAVGLGLAAGLGLVIPYLDHYLSGTYVGAQHLPPGAVFLLMLLVLVLNPVLRLLSRRLAFTRAELLTVYAMLLFATLVPGHGSESVFVPLSVIPFYYATPANGWESLLWPHIPDWLHPPPGPAIRGFFESVAPGQGVPWGAWAGPLLSWAVLLVALYLLAGFLITLLHGQWSQHEKLTFPLVALPLEMTQSPQQPFAARHFWGSGAMWAGFALAVVLDTLVGLKHYFPAVPAPTTSINLGQYFKSEPLAALGWAPVTLYLSVIGVSILLRTEVSLSVGLFFWLVKAQNVLGRALGLRGGQSLGMYPAWIGAQPWGGYLAYVGVALWTARGHLRQAWAGTEGRRPAAGDPPLPYRTCLLGVGLCLAVAVGWLTTAGMSLWSAAVSLVVYVVILIVISKVVVEAGLLFVQQTITPAQALNFYFGAQTVGARSLTVGMLFDRAFGTDLRASIAPSVTQSLRIAEQGGISGRGMLGAAAAAVAVALPLALASKLWVFYRFGAVNCNDWFCRASGTSGLNLLEGWLNRPQPPNTTVLIWSALGAGMLWAISALRARYLWFWPHPVGFIMAQTYPLHTTWFPITLAGVLKAVILRYGGPQALRRLTPAFLGLAFGDVLMMAVWILVSVFTGRHGHYLLPG